jgi:hypothetical protein
MSSESAAAEPAASHPAGAESAAAEPMTLDRAAAEPTAAEPTATEPTAADKASTSRPWWRVALHPIAIPLAFILSIWTAASIHPVWLVRPTLIVVGILLVAAVVLPILARDPERGALAAFAVGVGLVLDDARAVLLLVAFVALIVIDGIARRGRPWKYIRTVNRACSALAAALIVVSLFNMVREGALGAAVTDVGGDLSHVGPAATFAADAPDIWVILLDGYPGDDAMARLAPAWDRQAFPQALLARGFDVQPHSRTNYLITRLVLPTMFNGQLLETLIPPAAGLNLAEKTRLLRDATERGIVLRLLGDAGYERIAFSPGWAEVGPRRVDRLIEPIELTEFELALLRVSGAGAVAGALAPDLHSAQVRAQILDTIDATGRLAAERQERPRFVFIHFPAPHPPAVFDATGAPMNGSQGSLVDSVRELSMPRQEQLDRQVAYATYTGQLAVGLVDRILAGAARPPVIVIFSDHGSATGFDGNNVLDSDLDERTSNMLAVLSPGHPRLLPPGATLVNVFPHLLNAYLGSSLPYQPDSIWAWRSGANIFDTVELDPATWKPR